MKKSPEQEVKSVSMPYSAKDEDYHCVKTLTKTTSSVAAEGNVNIVSEPEA